MRRYSISGAVHIEYSVREDDSVPIAGIFTAESEEEALVLAVEYARSLFSFTDTYWAEWENRPEIACLDDPREIAQQDTFRAMVAAGMPTLPGMEGVI